MAAVVIMHLSESLSLMGPEYSPGEAELYSFILTAASYTEYLSGTDVDVPG